MDTQQTVEREQGLDLVRDLDVPPEEFNPLTASDRELLQYGLPLRPNARTHPHQAELWESFASRPLRFVRPPLTPLTDRPRSEIQDFRMHKFPIDERLTDVLELKLRRRGIRLCWFVPSTSTNWSGAAADRPASEPFVTVSGQWVVPSVSPPQSAWNGKAYNDGTYICAVWVGLDGWHGTNDVLQAGTNSVVTVTGGKLSTSYYSWIEWYGNPWTPESDFPVNPGDTVFCTVCAPFGNAHGTAMFVNQTTGLAMNYGINPPAGVTLNGNVAEWIVEDPGQLSGGLFPFPSYAATTFRNCTAGTKNISVNLGDACPINLVDGAGNVISRGEIDSDTSLTCSHT
jgi:Peptidase A4 family